MNPSKVKIVLRTKELIVFRIEPFLWIYFNIGKYEGFKRVAFDFLFELRGQTYGFSWEKSIGVRCKGDESKWDSI